ncbi:MAG: hypothetical protein U0T69_11185 [Chitinophagales bacterium]
MKEKNEYNNCNEKQPDKTGLYKTISDSGFEGTAFYSTNMKGDFFWVVPDSVKIVKWKPI